MTPTLAVPTENSVLVSMILCLLRVLVLNRATLEAENVAPSRPFRQYGAAKVNPREVEPAEKGSVIAIPQVGGLHHRYTRAA